MQTIKRPEFAALGRIFERFGMTMAGCPMMCCCL